MSFTSSLQKLILFFFLLTTIAITITQHVKIHSTIGEALRVETVPQIIEELEDTTPPLHQHYEEAKDDGEHQKKPSNVLQLNRSEYTHVFGTFGESNIVVSSNSLPKRNATNNNSNSSTPPPPPPPPTNVKFIQGQNQSPPWTAGAFIHLGKTGGSTLSQLLRNGCHTFRPKPCRKPKQLPSTKENYISKLTTYYHIPDFAQQNLMKNNDKNPYEFFVITTRDPLQRVISSFVDKHPITVAVERLQQLKAKDLGAYYKSTVGAEDKDPKSLIHHMIHSGEVKEEYVSLYTCFKSVEEYAQLLHNCTSFPQEEDVEELVHGTQEGWKYYMQRKECDNVAKSTLHHIDKYPMTHHYFDLQEILFQIHPNLREKLILIIRTENIWSDWTSANRYLGDDGIIYKTNSSLRIHDEMTIPESIQVNTTLSDSGRKNLCLALEKEYRLYLQLLVLAGNLGESDVEESFGQAKENCPWLNLKLPNDDEVETVVMSKLRGQYEF